jgi:thiamine biosynthesis lipoprotein ApbE
MRVVILAAAALSLAACVGSPSRVETSSPTVTYKYYGDTYGSQYDEVAARARDYCDAEFDKGARLRNVDEGGEEHYATFECV